MATKAYIAGHYFVLLIVAAVAVVVATTTSETDCQSERKAEQQRVGKERSQTFSEEQNNMVRVKKLIAEAEARMDAKIQAIVEAKLFSFSEAETTMETKLQNLAADSSRMALSASK